MIAQARYAAEKLKAAGFERHEFSVRTERIYRGVIQGRRVYEYGDAQISLRCPVERQHALIPAMLAAGLSVTLYTWNGGKVSAPFISDRYRDQGKLRVCHTEIKDKYGFNVWETI